ncbi:hypothetical protein Bca101_032484 [Brassica carinata]
MATSSTIDYEIITDPWDPKCARACTMYFPGKEPEDTELLLEKIRGKLDERIHNHTLAEEYGIIKEQIVKSQGFDVDFSKLRYLFNFQPAFLDDCDSDTGRDLFHKLSAEAIEIYNKREGTGFEFVDVEKANIYSNSGEVFFVTFVAKDPWNPRQKCFKLRSSTFSVERLYTASAGLNLINKKFLVLLGFMSSSAVALSVRCCSCRLSILWVLLLICSLPLSLMTALTSDLAQIRSSHKLHWPDLKILRRAPPSSSSWAMTFLPLGMIYSNWIWCERELHTVALHLPLDRSVKLYDSEHHFLFNPVRSPPLEDTLTSLCSPQTMFTYALPGICSLMSSLLDFDDQRVCLGSMTTLWIRRGNVGVRSFCLNPTPGYSANLAKLIFQEFVIRANRSSLLDLTLWCLPVTAVCALKPSYLVDSAFLCSSWSRTNMYSKLEGPSMEPCKLGLELQSYLYVYVPGQEPEGTKLMLEKIRGKRDKRIHNHTQAEEHRIINEQIVKSQGFDVDFSKLRYLFDFQPAFLDDCDSDTGRDYFGRKLLSVTTKQRGLVLSSSRLRKQIYTPTAKDPLDQTKVFQAKVIHVFCRKIVHSFCRLKPNQEVLKIKPGCNNSNLKVDGLSLADKQAAQPKSKEQRSSAATYENRAEGDEYKQRTMSELRNPFSALSSFNLSG